MLFARDMAGPDAAVLTRPATMRPSFPAIRRPADRRPRRQPTAAAHGRRRRKRRPAASRDRPLAGCARRPARRVHRHGREAPRHRLLAGLTVVSVEFALTDTPEGTLDPFFNINTPEDLARAARLCPLPDATMTDETKTPPIVGIAGWKNSGRRASPCASWRSSPRRRGHRVSTVKLAHHARFSTSTRSAPTASATARPVRMR